MSFCTFLFMQIPRAFRAYQRHYHSVKILTPKSHNLTFVVTKRFNHKPLKCWQCGIERKNIGDLFCAECSYIQTPPEKNNFFKVLEIDENFDVDIKELTQKYRQMQSLLHPDKFTNKSSQEKNISEEFSSLVNKAYHTLQTPLKRAIHLLHLRGQSIEEGQTVEDPEFLMEIMELNEEVAEADTDDKLRLLKKKNDTELSKLSQEIKTCFDRNQIVKTKEAIIKMKYYNSVSLHINNLMRNRGIVE